MSATDPTLKNPKTPNLKGAVIAHRNDRMGGRLIAMINAMRIADVHGLPFRVGWTTHGRTSPEIKSPGDIFEQGFIDAHFFGGEPLAAIWSDLIDLAALPMQGRDALIDAARAGRSFLSEAAIGCIVLPWEDPEAVKAQLPAYFQRISFSDPVIRAMRGIDAEFAGLSLRAYHIRRGDIISDPITSEKLWPNKYIPREFYEIHVRSFLAGGGDRCVVFSDTQAEVDWLKAIDPRIVSFDELVPHDGLKPGQRDILELYAMSKCPQIFGPPESAFSQTAATIGGGTVYAVQTSLSGQEQSDAMALMAARMEQPQNYFLGDGDLGQNFPFLIAHYEGAGQIDVARKIIARLVAQGFSRSYALSLLCRLSVTCGDFDAAEDVLEAAHQRPLVTEAAMADVNVYAALSHIAANEPGPAVQRIQAAYWLSPLDKTVTGTLNILLSLGWLSDQIMYPHDARLVRKKGRLFPQGNPQLDVFNRAPWPEAHAGPLQFYPWELAVRDWRLIHGKKLSRAFWHKGKMRNEMERLVKSSSKIADSAQLQSAVSVYLRYMEDFSGARAANAKAQAQHPYDPLYAKRTADVLLESGDLEGGIATLEQATEYAGANAYYQAQLGYWYGRARESDRAYQIFCDIADKDHGSIEVLMMTSEYLRRRPATRERALELIAAAAQAAHGAPRLLISKARLLLTMERFDAAEEIYRNIAKQHTAHMNTFVQMLVIFEKYDLKSVAESIISDSQFSVEEVRTARED